MTFTPKEMRDMASDMAHLVPNVIDLDVAAAMLRQAADTKEYYQTLLNAYALAAPLPTPPFPDEPRS